MTTPISATSPSPTAPIQTASSGAKHTIVSVLVMLQSLSENIKLWKKNAQQFRDRAAANPGESAAFYKKAASCEAQCGRDVLRFNALLDSYPQIKFRKITVEE